MAVDRGKWPVLVRVGLWGSPNRSVAWVYLWISVALAVGCVAYGFVNPRAFFGGLFVLAALWYFLSIRWVDQYSRWS